MVDTECFGLPEKGTDYTKFVLKWIYIYICIDIIYSISRLVGPSTPSQVFHSHSQPILFEDWILGFWGVDLGKPNTKEFHRIQTTQYWSCYSHHHGAHSHSYLPFLNIGFKPVELFFFEWYIFQLMVNCWFRLMVWIPGIPIWKGLLLGCIPRIPTHRAPNQQLTISWIFTGKLPTTNFPTVLRPPYRPLLLLFVVHNRYSVLVGCVLA